MSFHEFVSNIQQVTDTFGWMVNVCIWQWMHPAQRYFCNKKVCFAILDTFLSMVALGTTSKYPSSGMNASGINNITWIAFVLETYIFHLLLSVVTRNLEFRFRIENVTKLALTWSIHEPLRRLYIVHEWNVFLDCSIEIASHRHKPTLILDLFPLWCKKKRGKKPFWWVDLSTSHIWKYIGKEEGKIHFLVLNEPCLLIFPL